MNSFAVVTTDGRSTRFRGDPNVFLVMWKQAALDPENQWPYAEAEDDDGQVTDIVHFNPMLITAVGVPVDNTRGGE